MGLDPMWAHAKDITSRHADPECTIYAFGMPDEMPNWDQPRVQWVELLVCAEFDLVPIYDDDEFSPDERVATGWEYQAYIRDDADEMTEDRGIDTWSVERGYLRQLWRKLRPELAGGDDAYRRAVGLLPNPEGAIGRLLRWR